jgi:hypothetical protein
MASLPVRDPVGDHLLTPQRTSTNAWEDADFLAAVSCSSSGC